MERTSIFKLSRCWLRGFGFLVSSLVETKTQEDRLSASTRIFYLKRPLQGRQHMVNIQSGQQSLVIDNVHIKPELTLIHLRDILHLLNPLWPLYPNVVGNILGDFNICDPEGRFNVWNQRFTKGDPRKTAMFHFFHTSLRLFNLISRGGTPEPLGSYALFQGLIASL